MNRPRYIDQVQDMLNEPAHVLGGEIDFYESAIRVGNGYILESRDDGSEDAYASFIQRGNLLIMERPRKELDASYERWLNANGTRR